jgi:3-methylfumaryl-CoA hydratase
MIGEYDLGQDGYEMTHAPPAPFLARMWAGGGVEQNPRNLLRVGQDMVMRTKCTGVDIKTSREGKTMVFVTLEKLIENENGLALTDTRTLVYMEKDRENPVKSKLVKRKFRCHFYIHTLSL